jgi:hypothetical protein
VLLVTVRLALGRLISTPTRELTETVLFVRVISPQKVYKPTSPPLTVVRCNRKFPGGEIIKIENLGAVAARLIVLLLPQ